MVSGEGYGAFLVRSVAGIGAVRIVAMVASFLVGVQLARGLGVEGYGYYAVALSIVTVAGIPGEMGLSRLVTREVAAADAKHDLPHLFGAVRWTSRIGVWLSAAMVVGVVIAALVLAYKGLWELSATLLLAAPIIPLMTLTRIKGGALQGLHHIVRGQIPQNVLRPLFLSALLVATYLAGIELQPTVAMAFNSLSAAIALLICYHWLKHRLPKGGPVEIFHGGKRWFASMVPMALTEGMRVIQTEVSILLVGLITAPSAVGLFRIATVTAVTAAAPIAVTNRVAFPVIARLHTQGDRLRLQKAVTGLAWAGFLGVLMLSLPLLVAAEPLLRFVFGQEFGPAATALQILAIGQIINGAFGPNAALLNMTNHETRVTRAMSIALVLNLILVPLLLGLWGLTGAALGLVVSLLCWNVITWVDARRLLGVETSILPLQMLVART